MRLFRLELKRILKSRRTLILLAIALLLSVAMAYLPISFEGINRPNEDGTVTELDGLAAIKYKQDLYKTSAGEVTPDRIKSALETYQSCVREYGPVEEEGFPLAVFIEKKQGIYTHMQSEAHVPWFRVVFEMTDGSLMEFQMQQGDFRELEKGDQGMLTYQGNRYICYQKYKFKSEAQEEEKC